MVAGKSVQAAVGQRLLHQSESCRQSGPRRRAPDGDQFSAGSRSEPRTKLCRIGALFEDGPGQMAPARLAGCGQMVNSTEVFQAQEPYSGEQIRLRMSVRLCPPASMRLQVGAPIGSSTAKRRIVSGKFLPRVAPQKNCSLLIGAKTVVLERKPLGGVLERIKPAVILHGADGLYRGYPSPRSRSAEHP